jgi:hypothetical protein
MRFLPHEYAGITAALADQGIDPVSVLFVKRRGRMHVELSGRSDAFVFFREKSAKLDARGKWQEHVDYFLGMKKDDPVAWPDVLAALENWLAGG